MSDRYKHVSDCLEVARNARYCAGAEKAATEIERLRMLKDGAGDLLEEAYKENEAILKKNKRLREALEGWMIDHGHRCRICTERSQIALKGQT